ncbi:MAG: pstA 2, partial [Rhizobiaceae bacterium]|nr:pstA 2 [Rhizobiaceae bacterium]
MDAAVVPTGAVDWKADAMQARRARRYAADRRLRLYGIVAIAFALGFLAILLLTLVLTGYRAFTQTVATVEIDLSAAEIDRSDIAGANWRAVFRDALRAEAGDLSRADERDLFAIFTSTAAFMVRDEIMADPALLDGRASFTVPLSDPLDQLAKGQIDRSLPEDRRRVSDRQIEFFDRFSERGSISSNFNWGLFFNPDSRFPEIAGLAGAISGTFWALLVCFLISFPVGIAAAIYLEEFAPRNRFTDIIEININNLAAVPSVVFGLLGLAVFIGWFGLPRSTPLVGGMVLALMMLPTIIIVTRAALKAVPHSIREAALAVGA